MKTKKYIAIDWLNLANICYLAIEQAKKYGSQFINEAQWATEIKNLCYGDSDFIIISEEPEIKK